MDKQTRYHMVYPWGEARHPMLATSDASAKKEFEHEREVTVSNPMQQPIAVRKYITEDIIQRDVVHPEDAKPENPDGVDPTTMGPVREVAAYTEAK